jgi:pimeloyl-ACP methyl ester carboxylesterase
LAAVPLTLRLAPFVVAALVAGAWPSGTSTAAAARSHVRVWKIHYRAHNGARRNAYLVLPVWYGPKRNPPLPLIISPHGRGLTGRANARLWGDLPAAGLFAVINPDGQGRRLGPYSWGYAGQVADLARMPRLVRRALPWFRVDRSRIYAFGGSMGGQEVLLLAARHRRLLAGVAVFDAVTDLALQYREFPHLACNRGCRRKWVGSIGLSLQMLARLEIGGSPRQLPRAYARRSPLTYARRLAFTDVPIQFWWSKGDRVVINQSEQSGELFWTIRRLNWYAPVQAFVGRWVHSAEMRWSSRLPIALATFDLLPTEFARRPPGLHYVPPP